MEGGAPAWIMATLTPPGGGGGGPATDSFWGVDAEATQS